MLFPEREIYGLLKKLEENALHTLRKEFNEKMKKSKEMYSFCVHMLEQGKIIFQSNSHVSNAPTVTPMKPKFH